MKLKSDERRNRILEILASSKEPVSGLQLSKKLDVSRQVIVTDIAILRTNHPELISTNSGYILMQSYSNSRIFKVHHSDEQTEEELLCITDLGGCIQDVFVEHRVYGTIKAPLNISCKRDIENFMRDLKSGVSTPLKNVTDGYHYHTVEARSKEILDEIEERLNQKGFLIEVLESPVFYEAKKYNQV